jgi:hypothetical protein
MSSNTRNQLERWLKTIDVNGYVLDVGGSVQTLEGRVKSFSPKKYLIMDNGSEKGLHGKWIKPDIKWDISDPMSGNEFDNRFDQVFMIEVSEYIFDPYLALLNVRDMLKDDGIFYSSWHFIYCQHPPKGRDILRYTPDGVKFLLDKAGFKIVENIPRVLKDDFSKSTLMALITNEGMRGWKNFDNEVIGSLITARKI